VLLLLPEGHGRGPLVTLRFSISALPQPIRSCRIPCIARAHAYALTGMSTRSFSRRQRPGRPKASRCRTFRRGREIADCADLTIVPMLQPKPLPCRATCLVRSAQSAGAVGSQRLCPMRPMRALLKSDRRRCATQATRNGLVTLASVRSTSLSIRAPARPEHRARPRPGGPGREVVGRGLCRPRERGSPAHVSDPPVRSAQS